MVARTNILDMYSVYIDDDDVFSTSNQLIVLTCSSYVVFDDRSPSERSRVPTDVVLGQIEKRAYCACNALIDHLYAAGDTPSLRLLQSRLAQNECLDKVTSLLSERKKNGIKKTKIKI